MFDGEALSTIQRKMGFENLHRGFNRVASNFLSDFGIDIRSKLLQLLQKDESCHVADLGCGTGRALLELAYYPDVCILGKQDLYKRSEFCEKMTFTGIDLNVIGWDKDLASFEKDHRLLTKTFNPHINLLNGDISQNPLSSHSVDLALSYATLMYVPDGLRMLQETHRILKPSSEAYISMMYGLDGISMSHDFQDIINHSKNAEYNFSTYTKNTNRAYTSCIVVNKNSEKPFSSFPYVFKKAVPYAHLYGVNAHNESFLQYFVSGKYKYKENERG